ncbi:phage BR0599 family protein, partial [Paracoccus pantotrophus]|uniref:phage BR0599 family protein n=1 Tax=Paracoccus pantotrophus TaxID=82367 RepID=UPI00215DBBAA
EALKECPFVVGHQVACQAHLPCRDELESQPTAQGNPFCQHTLGHDVTAGIAVLTLLEAPVRAIAEGDAFTIRPGCDKRMETCGAKFANTANFRGFPHIPGQDAVLRYATKDGGHEGGVL